MKKAARKGGIDRAVVLDPKQALKQHVRKDFGRMKPKWWIGISGKQR